MTYGRKPKFVVKRVKEIQRHAAVSQALPAFVDYHRCGLTPSAARLDALNFSILAVQRRRFVNMRLARFWSAVLILVLALISSRAQDKPEYTFGTTVLDSFGL